MKKIFIFLFNGYADWEIAYLTPEINKSTEFELIYFSKDKNPVTSAGGLKVEPDAALAEINVDDVEVLIIPGGEAWERGENNELSSLAKEAFEKGKLIGAICGATFFLAQQGILDNLKHTSNDLGYLKAVAPQYSGERNYINSLAVSDSNVITAKGIAPIEFAREIFEKTGLYDKERIEKWFQLFKNGIWSE